MPARRCKRNHVLRRMADACEIALLVTIRIWRVKAATICLPEIVMRLRIELPPRLARLKKNVLNRKLRFRVNSQEKIDLETVVT